MIDGCRLDENKLTEHAQDFRILPSEISAQQNSFTLYYCAKIFTSRAPHMQSLPTAWKLFAKFDCTLIHSKDQMN